MALVYHLKPDELVRIADRRIGLSVGRDLRLPPIMPAAFGPGGERRPLSPVRSIEAPARPVFVIVELYPDEPLQVGGATIRWNHIRRRQHGMGPALLIDAPKATHPVEPESARYELRRSDIIGASS